MAATWVWIQWGFVALAALAGGLPAQEVLLPEGSRTRGELVFARSRCARCHVLPERPRPRRGHLLAIPLGGMWSETMTDGQLAQELVAPSHRIAPGRENFDEDDPFHSPMPSFASSLSVQDLADLVAFLRPRFPRPRPGEARRTRPGPGRVTGLPEGRASRGRTVFQEKRCTLCHVVDGVPLSSGVDQPPMRIRLGGGAGDRLVPHEIATEIASPSRWVSIHRPDGTREDLGPADSPMPDLARHLTVQDLADLVEFLRPAYGPSPR